MRPSLETLLEAVRDGSTYREMAEKYGVSASTIGNWLNETAEISAQSARAREVSAEAWLDRGMGYLERALSRDSGLDAGAARALAQECARRAAIRNPKYRDGQNIDANVNHTGLADALKALRG